MARSKPAEIVCIGGISTALAVLFQSAPVFLPGIGMLFSPLATLPIALVSHKSVYWGSLALFSSAFLLFFISPEEAVVFLLTTGIFGLSLGTFFDKGPVLSVGIAAGTLAAGIFVLTNVVGMAAFGDMTPDTSLRAAASIFILFSLLYSCLWRLILRFLLKIFRKSEQ